MSEIVKYGLIRDAQLFEWLEANMDKLLARDPAAVAYAVEQSCINKVSSVNDEFQIQISNLEAPNPPDAYGF